MSVWESVLVSILTSGIVISLLIFILKEYVKRYVQHEFRKKEKVFEKHQDLEFSVMEDIVKKRLGIYPEIIELIYRLRNLAREAVELDNPSTWNKPLFSQCCYYLTENLYKYRIFLPEETFIKLHSFKRQTQDFLLFADSADRLERLTEKRTLDENAKLKMLAIARSLNELYEELVKSIRSQIQSLFKEQTDMKLQNGPL